MERRLLTFVLASTAFFLVYFSLQTMFGPPPPPRKLADDAVADGAADPPADNDPAAAADADESVPANVEDPAGVAEKDAEVQPRRDLAPTWTTLGSMDPTSGYLMLITLNSRGAGVERIELTERTPRGGLKYQRVDVKHGYLGYFASDPLSSSGVEVNVVGPGTPADLAGIQVGDVITSAGGVPLVTPFDLESRLLKTEPGQELPLEVVRDGKPLSLAAVLSEHPLDLVRLAHQGGLDQVKGNLDRLSCLMTLSQIGRTAIPPTENAIPKLADPANLVWEIAKIDPAAAGDETGLNDSANADVQYELTLSASDLNAVDGSPIQLTRSYSVAPESYLVDLDLKIKNLGDQSQDLAYRLEGANGLTLEGWWYSNKISPNWSGASARDIVYNTTADGHELISGYNLLKKARDEDLDPKQSIFAADSESDARTLKYIGVDAQYFAVAYLPPESNDSLGGLRRVSAGVVANPDAIERHKERAVNSTFYLDGEVQTVPPGGTVSKNLRMFAGPKDPEILAQYGLSEFLYYGWFAPVGIFLGGILHVLSGVGNYALAIILLTVLVRGLMFPISRKAAVNAQKMQELAPELKKIGEKYKDDMEGRLKAQRELQQRVGFNPLAGCLPMFLQLPIFIGLYRALSVDIELRQQPLLRGLDWASNLAAPDQLAYWADWLPDFLSGRGTGWLGPYFNILPLAVVGLFLIQQKMFMPPATDEQTRLTQKMMNIMTLMMGLFFFRVPAGLCVYFITSSLWGIAERVIVKKTLPQGKHFDESVLAGETDAPAKPKKSQSIADRLREQVKGPEKTFEKPKNRPRPKKSRK